MNEHDLRTLAQLALTDPVYPSPLFPPSPYYRFLKRLAEQLQPSLSIELGVCGGGVLAGGGGGDRVGAGLRLQAWWRNQVDAPARVVRTTGRRQDQLQVRALPTPR